MNTLFMLFIIVPILAIILLGLNLSHSSNYKIKLPTLFWVFK